MAQRSQPVKTEHVVIGPIAVIKEEPWSVTLIDIVGLIQVVHGIQLILLEAVVKRT